MTKEATDNIAKAKETIEGLDPVIEETQESIDTMRKHIKQMEEECETGEDLSEHLATIQDLIKALEECPGKNDFILDIPEWKPADGASLELSAAPAAEPIATQPETLVPAAVPDSTQA